MRCYPFPDPLYHRNNSWYTVLLWRERKDLGKFNPRYPWPGVEYQGGALTCPWVVHINSCALQPLSPRYPPGNYTSPRQCPQSTVTLGNCGKLVTDSSPLCSYVGTLVSGADWGSQARVLRCLGVSCMKHSSCRKQTKTLTSSLRYFSIHLFHKISCQKEKKLLKKITAVSVWYYEACLNTVLLSKSV